MTFSLTFPRRSRLLHSGSYIPYPSRRANSLPTWNYWWFFKSVKQASRPQSEPRGSPFFHRPSPSSPRITSRFHLPYSRTFSIFLPPPAASRGRRTTTHLSSPQPLLSTLLFIFQTFHFSPPCASFVFPVILDPERRGEESRPSSPILLIQKSKKLIFPLDPFQSIEIEHANVRVHGGGRTDSHTDPILHSIESKLTSKRVNEW